MLGNLDPSLLVNDNGDWNNSFQTQQSHQYLQPQTQPFTNSPSPVPGGYGEYTNQQHAHLNPALYANQINQQYQPNPVQQQQQHYSPYGGSVYTMPQANPQYQVQPVTRPSPQQSYVQQNTYLPQGQPGFSTSQSPLHLDHLAQSRQSTQSPNQFQSAGITSTFSPKQWAQTQVQEPRQTYQEPLENTHYTQPQPTSLPSDNSHQPTNLTAAPTRDTPAPPFRPQKLNSNQLRITNQAVIDSLGVENSIELAPYLALAPHPVDYVITGKSMSIFSRSGV